MALLISEVADMTRHPRSRMPSEAGFWGGNKAGGELLSSTETGLCSELLVLLSKEK